MILNNVNISYIETISRTAQTTSASGNAQVSTQQFVFGNASCRTFANASQVQINSAANLFFAANPFTIEFRIRTVSKSSNFMHVINNFTSGFNPNQWVFADRHNAFPTKFTFWVGNFSTAAPLLTSNTVVSNNTWYAIAIVRTGNTWNMYVNGTLDTTINTTGITMDNAGQNIYINPNVSSATWYDGYVDELRISNIARYTGASYTLATQPFTNDANTVLLMHMDGTNGSTSFPDDNVGIYNRGITFTY